jgi:hypothetical protein
MVHVTNRPYVHMRLRTLKLTLGHFVLPSLTGLVVVITWCGWS